MLGIKPLSSQRYPLATIHYLPNVVLRSAFYWAKLRFCHACGLGFVQNTLCGPSFLVFYRHSFLQHSLLFDMPCKSRSGRNGENVFKTSSVCKQLWRCLLWRCLCCSERFVSVPSRAKPLLQLQCMILSTFFVTRCGRLLCLKAEEEVEVESWTFKFWIHLENPKCIAFSATFFSLRTRNLLGRGRYKAPGPAVAWIAQVFLGLEHMHLRMDTLLRDLKPDNVVISASKWFRHFGILQNHILSSYSQHRMMLTQHFMSYMSYLHVSWSLSVLVSQVTEAWPSWRISGLVASVWKAPAAPGLSASPLGARATWHQRSSYNGTMTTVPWVARISSIKSDDFSNKIHS